MAFVFKTSNAGSIVCQLKPMNRKEGIERITKLFEFLMINIMDKYVKTKIGSQWAKAVPLKDISTQLNEWSQVPVSYNRSVKIKRKATGKLLYFIRNVMI